MVQSMQRSDPLPWTRIDEEKMKLLAPNESTSTNPAVLDDQPAPRDVVQEVAASLKSLAKVLPYSEYASIVHRIAQLRWRCAVGMNGNAPRARPRADEPEPADR